MVLSLKNLFCVKKFIALAFVIALFAGCSKDQKNISKALALTAPLGCMVGAAIGKSIAKNKIAGAVAGAAIGGTAATVLSIATGGIIIAAASTAFNAIVKKLFRRKKRRTIKTVTVK